MAGYFYASYLPRSADDRLDWLSNLAAALPAYAVEFGISAAELAGVTDDFNALNDARVTLNNYTRTFSKSVTAYANELDTDPTPGPIMRPVYNAPAAPTPVDSGIFARIDALIQTKILPSANDTAKTALRLNPFEVVSTATALITAIEALARGQVGLTMNRGGSKLNIIYSRRGAEPAMTLLDKVADTHWVDARPNAVAGMSEARDYQIEWSFDGKTGDGHLSPLVSIATLA